MTNQILELKENYAAAKAAAKEWAEKYDEKRIELSYQVIQLQEAFDGNNAELIRNNDEADAVLADDEEELRAALVANFKETGKKTFDADLSVRVTEKIKYPTETALAWAKTNAPFLVHEVLDTKGFDPVAKAQNFDFVEVQQTVTAVISKTL